MLELFLTLEFAAVESILMVGSTLVEVDFSSPVEYSTMELVMVAFMAVEL